MAGIYQMMHFGCYFGVSDLYTGDVMFNYLSLRSRIAKLILNSLMIEKESSNTNMLLGK